MLLSPRTSIVCAWRSANMTSVVGRLVSNISKRIRVARPLPSDFRASRNRIFRMHIIFLEERILIRHSSRATRVADRPVTCVVRQFRQSAGRFSGAATRHSEYQRPTRDGPSAVQEFGSVCGRVNAGGVLHQPRRTKFQPSINVRETRILSTKPVLSGAGVSMIME